MKKQQPLSKKIMAVLMTAFLFLAMIPVPMLKAADTIPLTITPSAETVNVGDEVTFIVSMGSSEGADLSGYQFDLSIPSGMVYKADSAAILSGFKAANGWGNTFNNFGPYPPAASLVDTLRAAGGPGDPYNGPGMDIATFTLTADQIGSYTFTLSNEKLLDSAPVANIIPSPVTGTTITVNQPLSTVNVDLAAPAMNGTPQTTVSGTGYTGTVTWSDDPATFAPGTVYTATIALTANDFYVFSDSAFTPTVNGSLSGTITEKTGTDLVFVVTFPATPTKTDVSDTITFVGSGYTFDGKPQSLSPATTTDESGGSFTYSYVGTGETEYSASFTPPTNAGTYEVTATYESDWAIGIKKADLVISPLSVTITPSAGQSKTYGASEPEFTFTPETLTGGGVFSGALSRAEGEDVGEYPFTLGSISAGNNYALSLDNDSVTFAITPADYAYNVAETQNIKEGSGLSAITAAPAGGTGVDSQNVEGELVWYSDSERETLALDEDISALAVGEAVTLYWCFTATNGNYTDAQKEGQIVFTIVAGDPQSISFPTVPGGELSKTYGDPAFTHEANLSTGAGAVSYASTDSAVATVDITTGEVTIIKPGETTIIATAAAVPGTWAEASASYELTVAARSVTVTEGSYTVSKVYDGTPDAGTSSGSLETGILAEDSDVVAVSAVPQAFSASNAGSYTVTVDLMLSGDAEGKYVLLSDTVAVPGSIDKKPLADSRIEEIPDQAYTGSEIKADLTFTDTGINSSDYTVSYTNNIGVGTAAAMITATADGNYSGTVTAAFQIVKAMGLEAETPARIMVKADKSGTFDLNSIQLNKTGVGERSYALGTLDDLDGVFTLSAPPTLTDGVLSFSAANTAAVGSEATLALTVATTNYQDCEVVLTFEVTDLPIITLSGISIEGAVYGGNVEYSGTLTAVDDENDSVLVDDLELSYTYRGFTNAGTEYNDVTPPTEAGEYVLSIVGSGPSMIITQLEMPFTISKKTITITGVDQTVTVGTAPAEFAATIDGEVSGQPLTDPVTTASCPSYVDVAGSYPIIPDPSSDTSGNYEIQYVNGALTVNSTVRTSGGNGISGGGIIPVVTTPAEEETIESPTPEAVPGMVVENRLAGNDRMETAIAISKQGWPEKADNVVIAYAYSFADALAAAPLAAKLNAPILLTDNQELTASTLAEIQRLNPGNVTLVGGTAVLSSEMENMLSQSYQVRRYAGADQYATSAQIADALGATGRAVVVSGEVYQDALVISSYAANQGIPILFTKKDTIPTVIKETLSKHAVSETIVVGGTAVVSDTVFNQLPNPTRYAGSDCYETAVVVALSEKLNLNAANVYVVTGIDFPDALVAGNLASRSLSPLIMVGGGDTFPLLPAPTERFFQEKKDNIERIVVTGGTSVVTESQLDAIRKIIK